MLLRLPLKKRLLTGIRPIVISAVASHVPSLPVRFTSSSSTSHSSPTLVPGKPSVKNDTENLREKWYHDPYELSSKVSRLIRSDNINEAFELLKRHTGATNPIVLSTFFSALLKKDKHCRLAYTYYKKLKENTKIKASLTQSGYACLFACISKSRNSFHGPPSFVPDAKEMLEEAYSIMDSIPYPTVHLSNSFLVLCLRSIHVGGWEKAQAVYEDMRAPDQEFLSQLTAEDMIMYRSSKNKNDTELKPEMFLPDWTTHTLMQRMALIVLRDYNDQEVIDFGHYVWKRANVMSLREADLKKDDEALSSLVARYVKFCAALPRQDQVKALPILKHFFNLPKKASSLPSVPTSRGLELSQYTLKKCLLQPTEAVRSAALSLASRLEYPALGQLWYDIFTKQYNILPDTAAIRNQITLCTQSHAYHRAWQLANRLKPHEIGESKLMIAADACIHEKKTLIDELENEPELLNLPKSECMLVPNDHQLVRPRLNYFTQREEMLPPGIGSKAMRHLNKEWMKRALQIYLDNDTERVGASRVCSLLTLLYVQQAYSLMLGVMRGTRFLNQSQVEFQKAITQLSELSEQEHEINENRRHPKKSKSVKSEKQHNSGTAKESSFKIGEDAPTLLMKYQTLQLCSDAIDKILDPAHARLSDYWIQKFQKEYDTSQSTKQKSTLKPSNNKEDTTDAYFTVQEQRMQSRAKSLFSSDLSGDGLILAARLMKPQVEAALVLARLWKDTMQARGRFLPGSFSHDVNEGSEGMPNDSGKLESGDDQGFVVSKRSSK